MQLINSADPFFAHETCIPGVKAGTWQRVSRQCPCLVPASISARFLQHTSLRSSKRVCLTHVKKGTLSSYVVALGRYAAISSSADQVSVSRLPYYWSRFSVFWMKLAGGFLNPARNCTLVNGSDPTQIWCCAIRLTFSTTKVEMHSLGMSRLSWRN